MTKRSKPTLIDIAAACDTSIATVSRALSKPGLVQPETLERVRTVAASMGYVPNRRARALVSGRSNTVGVAVPTLNSPIFSATLQEMQKALAANGYQLLIASHEYDPAAEATALAQLISHGVDALVVIGAARPQSTWAQIDSAEVPLVQLWEGREGFDRVLVDNRSAGGMAAQHLLNLGHTRIAVICGDLAINDRQAARVDGIRTAIHAAGLALPDAQISEQAPNVMAGRSGCAALLEQSPRPTAIIGAMDMLAMGAMLEAQSRGISVPDTMSFVGIDNIDVTAHLSPALTTVDIPATRIGAEAAAMVLRRLTDDTPECESVRLPITMVVRQSAAPYPMRSDA
ncbi:HTH-type transcriptional regulator DegA [Roseibaca ekhonensis]|jgi:LacI family transcriptional regulator|uniref:HTH-type transcriptional regulator DegA n=1 Tax=Roseinatronobacter ekhonensis TaxID=254356 RepID=A0A3B0MP05_9RHOB|nr:substrate-binding domain-containing protein [Roseibaca ekhonensis]SUZ32727.1 HTH-type transcriptional regulator DegA [Roseibaca ekhonensis]